MLQLTTEVIETLKKLKGYYDVWSDEWGARLTGTPTEGGEGEGEEPEAAEEPPAEGDDGEKKKPAFKVEDWKWTVTDRRPKNLPQLFM
jgi:hypothetical protein